MKKLPYSTLYTNAAHNRDQATRLFKAGYTPQEIADAFPLIWKCTDGAIGQRYDSVMSDERKEIDAMMASEAVATMINARAAIVKATGGAS